MPVPVQRTVEAEQWLLLRKVVLLAVVVFFLFNSCFSIGASLGFLGACLHFAVQVLLAESFLNVFS